MTFDHHKAGSAAVHTKNHDVNGQVTVTIRDKHTGKLFTKPATVTLTPPAGEATPGARTCGPDGKAVFTGLGTGRYIAAAAFPGYSFVPEGERRFGSDQLTLLAFKRKVYWGIDSNLGFKKQGDHALDLDHARSQDISFVCRYLSVDIAGHTALSKDEAPRYRPYGMALVAIWEKTKYRAIQLGSIDAEYAAGKQDGAKAMHQLEAIGAPGDAVCYFTADFDLAGNAHADGDLRLVQAYFEGIHASVKQPGRVGVYGTYDCIMRLYDQQLVRWAWQMTFGAKGLVIDDRVSIYQYDIWPDTAGWGVQGPGALDLDCAVRDHYGQFHV